MTRRPNPTPITLALTATVLPSISGCITFQRAPTPTEHDDVVFYCGGAGGGSLLTNWGTGVKQGLERDGYEGDFRDFRWQTGLGVLADQTASVNYKRRRARDLVVRMRAHWRRFPGGSVHLIGLSAGSAIVVHALEELPPHYKVDTVILLGSSLSADYDLRRALRRVRGEVFVFTSSRDRVLQVLMPLTGTADRQYVGSRAVGRYGFQMPEDADDELEALYSKVVSIEWDDERQSHGDPGTHTGATNARFVQAFIAPLIHRDGPRYYRLTRFPDESPD